MVSIHAPREGCDVRVSESVKGIASFNSRTPGGVRLGEWRTGKQNLAFQFTHPGRGATDISEVVTTALTEFQFTHPGRGATLAVERWRRAGGFQFTHPGRGATVWCKVAYYGADKQA